MKRKPDQAATGRDYSPSDSYNAIGIADSYGVPVIPVLVAPNVTANPGSGYLPPPNKPNHGDEMVGGGETLGGSVEDEMMAETNMINYNLTPNIHYGYFHVHDDATTTTTTTPAPSKDDDDRGARFVNFLKDSKITLEANIKTSTPIPFCQFPNSPCKDLLIANINS